MLKKTTKFAILKYEAGSFFLDIREKNIFYHGISYKKEKGEQVYEKLKKTVDYRPDYSDGGNSNSFAGIPR